MNTDLRICRATLQYAANILALQKLAYQTEAALYDDYGAQFPNSPIPNFPTPNFPIPNPPSSAA